MLDTIGDLVSGLVELVARGVFAVVRGLFRWEASTPRPGWVRAVAIGLILLVAAGLVSLLLSIFAMLAYLAIAIAAIGAAVAWFGAG
jgi:hypothetical protein